MGVSSQTLIKEKNLLTKTFKELSDKIAETEKQMQVWRNTLNAVGGAIQQIDKLLVIDDQMAPKADGGSLNIAEKEKPKLLNEGEK